MLVSCAPCWRHRTRRSSPFCLTRNASLGWATSTSAKRFFDRACIPHARSPCGGPCRRASACHPGRAASGAGQSGNQHARLRRRRGPERRQRGGLAGLRARRRTLPQDRALHTLNNARVSHGWGLRRPATHACSMLAFGRHVPPRAASVEPSRDATGSMTSGLAVIRGMVAPYGFCRKQLLGNSWAALPAGAGGVQAQGRSQRRLRDATLCRLSKTGRCSRWT